MKLNKKIFFLIVFFFFLLFIDVDVSAVEITDETYKALYDEGIQVIIDKSDYDNYIDSIKDFVVFETGVFTYYFYIIDNENYNSNSFSVVSREDESVNYYLNCNAINVWFPNNRSYYMVQWFSNGGGGAFPIENSLQFSTIDIYLYESVNDVLNNTNGSLFFKGTSSVDNNYTDFKIHIKDINCAVWRNFTIKFPDFQDYKYIAVLDTYLRDDESCVSDVTAKIKLYVLTEKIETNPYLDRISGLSNIERVERDLFDIENNYLAYMEKDTGKIYMSKELETYALYESNFILPSSSNEFNMDNYVFEFKETITNNEIYDEEYYQYEKEYPIFGNFVCDKDFFIGSNMNIYSIYKKTFIESLKDTLFSDDLLDIFRLYKYDYGAVKSYDYEQIYLSNSSCYDSNEYFENEYWCNFRNDHNHFAMFDEEGNRLEGSLSDNELNSLGYLSGSSDYEKVQDNNNVLNYENKDILEYIPVVQTPTITDTFLVENDSGEYVENNDSLLKTDEDIAEKDDETSSWGVLDFLKGLFSGIGDIVKALGSLVFELIQGILGLFIPDDNFWSEFSEDMNVDLEESLGLLFQPFDLMIGVFERYNNIDFGEPVLNFPEIKVPLTDYVLMQSQEFNFNSILENDTFNYVHEIYLMLVDAYFVFLIVNRIIKIQEEVFEK